MDSAAAASSASELAQRKLVMAHQTLLHTPGLQFDFEAAKPPAPPPPWLVHLLHALAPIAPIIGWAFLGGLALGAIAVVWLIGRDFMQGRKDPPPARALADWRPEPAQARILLEDADRLAAAGRFDEAVHLILVRSIADIARHRPGAVRPALTSRDIGRIDGLPGAARAAFTGMAETVERSLFGGRPVAAADFGRCRGQYEAFAFATGWA